MRTLTRAAVRIILAIMFLQTFFTALNYLVNLSRYSVQSIGLGLLLILGVSVISFIILGLLWWRTEWLVNLLAGRVSNHELIITTTNTDFFRVSLRVLGFYLLADAIPALLGMLGHHLYYSSLDIYSDSIIAGNIRDLITIGAKILIGIGLIIGTRGISKTASNRSNKAVIKETGEKAA